MAVARSYENMQIVGDPFEQDGKKWVRVIGPCKRCGGSGRYSFNPKDGDTCFRCGGKGKESMNVRWYTDSQRASMDRTANKRIAEKEKKNNERRIRFSPRNAMGFGDAGFVTLIQGDNNIIKKWRDTLPPHVIFFNPILGWYIPSNKKVDSFPDEINHYHLNWSEVCDEKDEENLSIKDSKIVSEYIHALFYGKSKSNYQGEKGEWIEAKVTIIKNIVVASQFGSAHMHIMEDDNDNIYVWTTSSKNIEEGKNIYLKMKVKEHKEYKGEKQTIVYYCHEQ